MIKTKNTRLQTFRCCTLLCLLSIRIGAAQNDATESKKTQQAFIQAVRKGDETKVNALINEPAITVAFLNTTDFLGMACRNGDYNIVKTLIDKGIDVNGGNPKLTSSVGLAIHNGYYNITQLLIQEDAKLTSDDLCEMLEKNPSLALTIAQKMIANSWDINAKDAVGARPLTCAILHRHHDVVTLLVNNNADIAVKGLSDNTALHRVAELPEDDPIVALLMNKIKGKHGMINTLKGIQNNDGNTPLHGGLKSQHFKLAKFFIEEGFVNNIKNNDGNTPLHMIAKQLSVSSPTTYAIAKLVIEKGGWNHIQNNLQETPIALIMQGSSKKDNKDLVLTIAKTVSSQEWQAILGDDALKKGIQDLGVNIGIHDTNTDIDTSTDAERPMFTRKEVWVVSIMVVIGLVIWGMASQEASEEAPKIGSQEKLKRKPNKKVKNKVNKKHAQTTRSEAQNSSVV